MPIGPIPIPDQVTDLAADLLGILAGATPSGTFLFSAAGFPADWFSVISFTGTEELSGLYHFEVTLSAPADDAFIQTLDRTLLANFASFTMSVPGGKPRTVHGVVNNFRLEGVMPSLNRAKIRLELVPKFWMLTQRKHSRIFQDKTTREIVSEVLDAWQIRHVWRLVSELLPRSYATQYQETDFEFVSRILAEDGIFYFFKQPTHTPEILAAVTKRSREQLVFSDDGAFYSAVPELGGDVEDELADLALDTLTDAASDLFAPLASSIAPVAAMGASMLRDAAKTGTKLTFRDSAGMRPTEEHVYEFAYQRSVRPTIALLGDYDFRNPALDLHRDATLPQASLEVAGVNMDSAFDALSSEIGPSVSAIASQLSIPPPGGGDPDPEALRHYVHHDRAEHESQRIAKPKSEISKGRANQTLEQLRADRALAFGKSWCRRLTVGHTFRLEDHALSVLNRDYVVTVVRHRGVVPEAFGGGENLAKNEGRVYSNEFVCAPSAIRVRPPAPPPRLHQVCETAVVVGPSDEVVYVDTFGRVKIQFHWDLDGKRDEKSSCFVRTTQGWSGDGWGMQFIPRIGMEVVVTFLGGDPDRPIISGCVYNGTHPTPFALPSDKSRSGIRTQTLGQKDDVTVPPGRLDTKLLGFNELSFDDSMQREQIYLHAERNYDEVVEVDHSARMGRDDYLYVRRNQTEKVEGNRESEIVGNRTERVGKDEATYLLGRQLLSVGKDASYEYESNRATRVLGRDRLEVKRNADWLLRDDLTVVVQGCATTVVGKNDAKRSQLLHVEGRSRFFSTDESEHESKKSILLRVGNSSILVGPESISVCTPKFVIGTKEFGMVAKDSAKIRSKKVQVMGDGAGMTLDENVKVIGTQLLFSAETETEDEQVETKQPTTFTLTDQDGNPIPYQRYVLKIGEQLIAGVTDHEGKDERRDLTESGEVRFPDLAGAEEG